MFKTIKRIISRMGNRKKRLYIGFIWSFLGTICISLPIMASAYILTFMFQKQPLPVSAAFYTLLFMIVAVLGRFLFSYLRATYQDSIAYELTAETRISIGNLLQRVSLGFFDKNNVGEISTAVTTDLATYEMYAMNMIDLVVNGVISTAAMILCVAYYSIPLAFISLAGILLSAFFLNRLETRSHINAPVHQDAQDDMTAATIEYIHGIATIKAYGKEGVSMQSIKSTYRDSRDINLKIEREYIPYNCLHLFALKTASVLLIALAASLTIQGDLNTPVFLMLTIFSFVIFNHMEKINNATHVMELLDTAMNKLEAIEQTQTIDFDGGEIELTRYDISFDHVTFSYDQQITLNDISFTIPQNTTTAIVGPSGSGKTTICNLLARFYDPDSGIISIGGQNLHHFTCDSLLKNISMVFQNVYLFHDTIRNNIRFGNPTATEEQIHDAAKKACCYEFIMKLPGQFDTMIGEGGSSLSGGEKQRISIARAILKNAPIVILDEATASVDPENEYQIQAAINSLTSGKTIIIIAHRLATIEHADQILVMDQGAIVQTGTHQQLSDCDGIYKHFIEIRKRAEGWIL